MWAPGLESECRVRYSSVTFSSGCASHSDWLLTGEIGGLGPSSGKSDASERSSSALDSRTSPGLSPTAIRASSGRPLASSMSPSRQGTPSAVSRCACPSLASVAAPRWAARSGIPESWRPSCWASCAMRRDGPFSGRGLGSPGGLGEPARGRKGGRVYMRCSTALRHSIAARAAPGE